MYITCTYIYIYIDTHIFIYIYTCKIPLTGIRILPPRSAWSPPCPVLIFTIFVKLSAFFFALFWGNCSGWYVAVEAMTQSENWVWKLFNCWVMFCTLWFLLWTSTIDLQIALSKKLGKSCGTVIPSFCHELVLHIQMYLYIYIHIDYIDNER